MKMENDAAVQLHAANTMADAAETEKIAPKKQVQDLTWKLETTNVTPENSVTLTRNRELAYENKKLNAALARYQKMEEELASLKEITDQIPEFRAEYDRVIAERNEREASLARYGAFIIEMEETNAVKDNVIKDLRMELAARQQIQPVASTSPQAKRPHTDMETSRSDLINFADVEQHINNSIGSRFQKIEESQRQLADAMDQIRAALITNMPSVNFAQFPRIQRSSTPARGLVVATVAYGWFNFSLVISL